MRECLVLNILLLKMSKTCLFWRRNVVLHWGQLGSVGMCWQSDTWEPSTWNPQVDLFVSAPINVKGKIDLFFFLCTWKTKLLHFYYNPEKQLSGYAICSKDLLAYGKLYKFLWTVRQPPDTCLQGLNVLYLRFVLFTLYYIQITPQNLKNTYVDVFF